MKKKILIIAIIILLLAAIPITYFIFKKDETPKPNDLAEKYDLPKDNIYEVLTESEAIDFIKNGTGILFLSFPSCPRCQKSIPIINEMAKENGFKKVMYFDPQEIRSANTKNYQEIVSLLKEHLKFDDEGKERIFVPDVFFIKKGKILGNQDNYLSGNFDIINDMNEERVQELKDRYQKLFDKLK